jgi:putative aldouronate transport system permease protein
MPSLRKETFWQKLWKQKVLVFMSIPFVVHLIIFRYVPLTGWFYGFTNANNPAGIAIPLFQQEFIGFKNFIDIFTEPIFLMTIRNTLAMSVIKLVLGTIFAILVAILINETRKGPFKRVVQTISYLPHFISWVVASNLVLDFLSPYGILNDALVGLGLMQDQSRELWMGQPNLFWWIIGWSHVWKTAGFGAIIFLAAMTGIDPQLYEAADMDGAGRLRRIWHITLPGIQPVIMITTIMNIGYLMQAGFEQQWLLRNWMVQDVAWVFQIFVFEQGLRLFRYSFSVAAGIFESVVSLILLFTANRIAGFMKKETLF